MNICMFLWHFLWMLLQLCCVFFHTHNSRFVVMQNGSNSTNCGIKMCGIFFEFTSCESCKVNVRSLSFHHDDKILGRIRNRGPDCAHTLNIKLDNNTNLFFYGTVLWMQGAAPVQQPIENHLGVLLFNGDIFDEAWDASICDTQVIMNKLGDASSSEEQIISVLQSLKGPFSIIYYDKMAGNLYFGRDKIGRTTLLCYKDEVSFVLSSVLGRKHKCIEVPAHLYKLNFSTNKLTVYSWESSKNTEEHDIETWMDFIQKQQKMPDDDFPLKYDTESFINSEDEIISYIKNMALKHTCKLTMMQALLQNNKILKTTQKITSLLEKSIRIRLKKQPQKCKECIKSEMSSCCHCTVGVLFSGGLDCTILALLADKYVPINQPIDLINVAFKMDDTASYDVPDRLTGRQSLEELKEKCKSRQWVFREINVPKEKLEKYQENTIADLVYPRYTILDESLGSALWFAALAQDDNGVSACRVLLLGSGADELFGGYVRHRNAFKRNSWTGLSKELFLDWKRISFRNLARDNRVICDHGRQPRMPYLDEDFTDYVLKLKPWMKCFPSEDLPCGIGDKLMLRLVAFNLGLIKVATFPKRALQFGSRIAKKKERGSDISKTFSII